MPEWTIAPEPWTEIESASGLALHGPIKSNIETLIKMLDYGMEDVFFAEGLTFEFSGQKHRKLQRFERATEVLIEELRSLPFDILAALERKYEETIRKQNLPLPQTDILASLQLQLSIFSVAATLLLKLNELSKEETNNRRRSPSAKLFLNAIHLYLHHLGKSQNKTPSVRNFLAALWPHMPARARQELASVEAALKTLQRMRRRPENSKSGGA